MGHWQGEGRHHHRLLEKEVTWYVNSWQLDGKPEYTNLTGNITTPVSVVERWTRESNKEFIPIYYNEVILIAIRHRPRGGSVVICWSLTKRGA